MTYIIGMISQKGGAGKSTLARLFARELAQDNFTVKIADLDTPAIHLHRMGKRQGRSWNQARDPGPAI